MQYLDDKGHLTDEALSLHVDALKRGQPEQLPEALREHLEQCAACQEEAMALYALVADQDYSELGPHPTLEENRSSASALKMWFRPLLLLLMAVMALFLFWQQQQQATEPPPVVEEKAPPSVPSVGADSMGTTVPLSPPQAESGSRKPQAENRKPKTARDKAKGNEEQLQAIAANFTPNESLEGLVGAVTRSQGLSGVAPANGAVLNIGETVVFSWQTTIEEPLSLRLLNNREEEVFSRPADGNRLSSPVALEPGLYYWKLETREDLLYVGKFFVGRQSQ